jgi:hypothetical protein
LRRAWGRVSIRRMRKNILLATILVLATTAPALAGGKEGTVGVGAELGLSRENIGGENLNVGGVSANYDAGLFHVGGFLGFHDGGNTDDTDYTFGARFYFHLHDSTLSDFGIGGAIGFYSRDDRGVAGQDRDSLLFFEPGIQIRAFVANNVALSFTAGLSFGLADADGADFDGQLQGLAGVHYYFFR